MNDQPARRWPLPGGPLVAWYGDDFTGSAAVMEALTFAGLPSMLFFDVPRPEQLARFPGLRGIGIAGIARSKGPGWMRETLPPIFTALRDTGAPLIHHKICSTFDSSPEIGSIGAAIEIGEAIFGNVWIPLITAAPALHRYQAFGNLFATVAGKGFRLDRHPTMSRHPVTPMNEADLGRHLAQQTDMLSGLVDFVAMKQGRADTALERALSEGARIVSLDVVDDETLAEAGRLVWDHRETTQFVVGSQGVEYALIAHWQSAWLMPAPTPTPAAPKAEHVVAVSGSCSPVTAQQIAWAEDHGFAAIRLDAAAAVDARAWANETARAVDGALAALSRGNDPVVYTARGPDDASVPELRRATEAAGLPLDVVNDRIGDGLGRILDAVMRRAGIDRGIIAGGDTSSHAALALGVFALSALAPTVPGAALCKAHSEDPAHRGLELALKGGQMGTPDYFGRIKAGGQRSA
jgi:3-oxoisoapionate kinase